MSIKNIAIAAFGFLFFSGLAFTNLGVIGEPTLYQTAAAAVGEVMPAQVAPENTPRTPTPTDPPGGHAGAGG